MFPLNGDGVLQIYAQKPIPCGNIELVEVAGILVGTGGVEFQHVLVCFRAHSELIQHADGVTIAVCHLVAIKVLEDDVWAVVQQAIA